MVSSYFNKLYLSVVNVILFQRAVSHKVQLLNVRCASSHIKGGAREGSSRVCVLRLVDVSNDYVFIIDKERHQRGRLDDRTKTQKEKDAPIQGLYSYNALEVSELKNKMSEDMRILFTEYRQKRKGKFDSNTRRADDILKNEIN